MREPLAYFLDVARALPSHFLTPPTTDVPPHVSTLVQELPFGQLTWENFEKLCIRLALAESTVEEFDEVRPYGVQGDDQEGIDLFARLSQPPSTDGTTRYRTYQCKKVESFGPAKIKAAVRLFIRGKWRGKSDEFVLCTSESMALRSRTDAVERQRRVLKRLGIKLVLWDSVTLNQKLKTEPEIVDDFFGREWVRWFCGENLVAQETNQIITRLNEQIAQKDQLLVQQTQTISQLSQAVVNLSVPPAPSPLPASDVRWADNIERAERWSESVQIPQIHAAQELIREVRESEDFESLSIGLRVRAATVSGKCALALDDNETAAREMDEALRLAPDEVRCLSNAAAAAFLRSEWSRALDLAQKALVSQNDNLNAAMILVQVWAQIGEADRIEPFLQANAWFLESDWGLSALSHVENQRNNFDSAYDYAKQALAKNPDHIAALDNLADAVFLKLRCEIRAGAQEFGQEAMARFDEAEAALTRGIDLLRNRPSLVQYHRFLCNRAVLRNTREDYRGALDDCHLVLYGSPNAYNRDFATYTRGLIHMNTGEYPKAIEDLEVITDAHLREESAMALAHCYQKSGRWDEAAARLESLWHSENGDHTSFLVAEMLLQTHRARKDEPAIAATLERLEATCPNSPLTLSIRAYDYFLRGSSEKAIETIQYAQTLGSSGAERQEVFLRMGEIYYGANRYTEAADAWKEANLTNSVASWHNPALDYFRNSYVYALYNANRFAEALQLAQEIRQHGTFDPSVAHIEAITLISHGKRQEARELFAEILQRTPQYTEARLNAIFLEVEDNDPTQAHALAGGIYYEAIKDDAVSLRRVALMLAPSGWRDAIRFAFRARQIDFGNPESHRVYFQVHMDTTQALSKDENGEQDNGRAAEILGLNRIRPGTVPCSIRLWPEDAGLPDPSGNDGLWNDESVTYTIWPEPPHDRTRDLLSPEDSLGKELLKLQRGDYFHLPTPLGRSPKRYRVVGILHPYTAAFQEISMRSQELFPDRPPVVSMNIGEGFKDLEQLLQRIAEGDSQPIDAYRNWELPLCSWGQARALSLCDLWLQCAQIPEQGLNAMRFATNEFESSVSDFRQVLLPEPQGQNAPAVTVVLDYTALMALACAQVAPSLEHTLKFVAPLSLKAYIERLHRETRIMRGEGISSYEANQPTNGASQRERLNLLERILAFLENHVELTAPQSAAPAGVNVKRLRRLLGDTTTDSILLAHEQQLPLYSDDAVLVRGLKSVLFLELQAGPSQVWLTLAETTGKITQATYRESIDRLNIWNYRFTHFDAEFLLWLFDRDAWKVTGSVQAAFRQLHGPLCHPQAAVGLCA